jgi:hypothetical protein
MNIGNKTYPQNHGKASRVERPSIRDIRNFLLAISLNDALAIATLVRPHILVMIKTAVGPSNLLWKLLEKREVGPAIPEELTFNKRKVSAKWQLPPLNAIAQLELKRKPGPSLDAYSVQLLNRMEAHELLTVPSIDTETAARIVNLRKARPFRDVKDLLERIPYLNASQGLQGLIDHKIIHVVDQHRSGF